MNILNVVLLLCAVICTNATKESAPRRVLSGEVAECPLGYVQSGTLSADNDVRGMGLGQQLVNTIEGCKTLCQNTLYCNAFMYGGNSVDQTSTKCKLSGVRVPNGSYGTNWRFCQRNDVAECPAGWVQKGTLDTDNDMAGKGLGQWWRITIEECRDLCLGDANCHSFMYGGSDYEEQNRCELSAYRDPNGSWGSNWRFCTQNIPVADCPTGYVNRGTLDTDNDQAGVGLGVSNVPTIEDCKDTCDATNLCVSFMYGGIDLETGDRCQLGTANVREPNSSWGTNWRFCSKHAVAECPAGYTQMGSLTTDNDIAGQGLGQHIVADVDACKAMCDANNDCAAFMYGNENFEKQDKCQLTRFGWPNNSWGSNWRFCQQNRVVEECPRGWSQKGTLSVNNDMHGRGMGVFTKIRIHECQQLCMNTNGCVAFGYGGRDITEGDRCELSSLEIPNASWGTNWRYCVKNTEVRECPGGYVQYGTLNNNNDINGNGLGQFQRNTIEGCQDLCEETPTCVAFMYGGDNQTFDKKCELSNYRTPNESWGTNWRFCARDTACAEYELHTNDYCAASPTEDCNGSNGCTHLATHSNTSPLSACQQHCRDHADCKYISYTWKDGECSLYDRCPDKRAYEGELYTKTWRVCKGVAECPYGFQQVGETDSNNDIAGQGLGKHTLGSIEECGDLCDAHGSCEAFTYGGSGFAVQDQCKLLNSDTPTNDSGRNRRFCKRHLEYVGDCPSGYTKRGTLSTDNDVAGQGLGETTKTTIGQCRQWCEDTADCKSFMYGGEDTNVQDLCKISTVGEPNGMWGSNWRFCAKNMEVADCPSDYTQHGTLSTDNDIAGNGLGVQNTDTIAECRQLCEDHNNCISFMYGGTAFESNQRCELSNVNRPNSSYGANWRFCTRNVPVAECPADYTQHGSLHADNDIIGRSMGQFDADDIDACRQLCEDEKANGCVSFMYGGEDVNEGNKCELGHVASPNGSWGTNWRFCQRNLEVAECPDGYTQVGTLSTNNDVPGVGLGQSSQVDIDACKDACENLLGCVAFMYGGQDLSQGDMCELANTKVPSANYGTNQRFCARNTRRLLNN